MRVVGNSKIVVYIRQMCSPDSIPMRTIQLLQILLVHVATLEKRESVCVYVCERERVCECGEREVKTL